MSESTEQRSIQPVTDRRRDPPKKPYDRPFLIEWGSLSTLTEGPNSGLDDLPLYGGTENE
jgi:hypothetical protein